MSLEETLEAALQANRSLQSSIHLELERLARRKADNRRTAARLLQQLTDTHTVDSRKHCLPSNASNKHLTRKWNRFFFNDGSTTPERNADTLRRRNNLEKATFFFHLQPPWTKKETNKLQSIIQELQSGCSTKEDTNDETIDFEQVARRFNNSARSNSKEPGVSRSPTECRIQYQSLRKPAPFSKQEMLQISEQVHMYQEQKQPPDWQAIASSLSSTSGPTNQRTAWDCLVAYQNTKLCPVQPQTWTVSQDEFLLKYMAAAGPQFVVDGESIQHLLTLLNGSNKKTKSQLLGRINQSLVNPNLKRDFWDSDEERKLAILMKVYSDYDSSPSQAPLYMASTHLPHRSTKSVADKWNRSLNPEYSSQPFSEAEDQKLLEIVRNEPHLGWTEISQQHFPGRRHAQRLSNRWSELAKDEDILQKSRNLLVRERRRLAKDEPQETTNAAALTANDFVVQVKKKPRR